MIWKALVLCAALVILISFSFLFIPGIQGPSFLHLPFLLWTGILATALLVLLTFLGSKYFTPKEK